MDCCAVYLPDNEWNKSCVKLNHLGREDKTEHVVNFTIKPQKPSPELIAAFKNNLHVVSLLDGYCYHCQKRCVNLP
jgi:hypothetical protein